MSEFITHTLETAPQTSRSLLQSAEKQLGFIPILELILAISFKTLSNYINHINDTPIDAQFLTGIPENKSAEEVAA